MDDIDTTNKAGDADTETKRAAPATPSPEEKPAYHDDTSTPNHDDGKAANDAKAREQFPTFRRLWNWIKADTKFSEWAIVALTLVIAVTTGLQWEEIHSGSEDTRALVVAAKAQAAAAQTQANSLKLLAQSERPRLAIESIRNEPPAPRIGEPFRVIMTVRNVGRAVAVPVSWDIRMEPVLKGEIGPERHEHFLLTGFATIGASGTSFITVPLTTKWNDPIRPSADLVRQIATNEVSLMLHGLIEYSDEESPGMPMFPAGARYVSDFCYLYIPRENTLHPNAGSWVYWNCENIALKQFQATQKKKAEKKP
jgi:hypothetical protein